MLGGKETSADAPQNAPVKRAPLIGEGLRFGFHTKAWRKGSPTSDKNTKDTKLAGKVG